MKLKGAATAFWPIRDVAVPHELREATFAELRERADFQQSCRKLRNRRKKARQLARCSTASKK